MTKSIVTKEDFSRALREIGVSEGDICLFHSSFKSLGTVEGGAQSIIDGFEAVLGKEGTLVAPTLIQKDFQNAYRTWYMDKPSDVGFLTEFFRKQIYVYRSNQETHSVAARGKYAYELTHEHTAYGPHLCPFGEYAFADSSPWRKMYDRNAKVVFIGVTMRYHTMKHMIEATYVEDLLASVADADRRQALQNRLITFGCYDDKIWPFYEPLAMQAALDERGLIRKGRCGDADLYCVNARETADATLTLLKASPEKWFGDEALRWIRECEQAASR